MLVRHLFVFSAALLVPEIMAAEQGKTRLLYLDDSVPRLETVTVDDFEETKNVPVGTLEFRKQYQFVLPIQNKTPVDWKILKVRSDCGCTVGVPVSRKFAKKQTSSISLSVKPKRVGKFRISLAIQLENKQANDVRLIISGRCLDHFVLDRSRFAIDEPEAKIRARITSNFVAFDKLDALKVRSTVFDRVSVVGNDPKFRTLVGTLSNDFLRAKTRHADSLIHVESGDRQSQLSIEIVRKDVVELRPSILVFERKGDRFYARCFIRGDKVKLERLVPKTAIRARSKAGEIEAELSITQLHGDLAVCSVSVGETFSSEFTSKSGSDSVEWLIEGIEPVSTIVAFDR